VKQIWKINLALAFLPTRPNKRSDLPFGIEENKNKIRDFPVANGAGKKFAAENFAAVHRFQ